MAAPNCTAIILGGRNIGVVCGKAAQRDHTRCRVHQRSLESNGPHATQRKELTATQKKELNEHNSRIFETPELGFNRLREILEIHQQQATALRRAQRIHVRQHGDPDAEANAARERVRNNRMIARAEDLAVLAAVMGNARPQPAPPVNELAAFARDNQNVHTIHAVEQTKKIINKILEIKVPVRYQWNKRECSKTPGQIIMQCRLSPTAAWQMTAKYCQVESIYEMGEGIYGRVLDCVWQFVLASPDKEDLTKIVKSEMEDNIGMCAQGNLSRLCNILSGYLDDIVIKESPAEIMGRLISGILNTADAKERARKMTAALIESGMPPEKWIEWAEPAFDERIVVIHNTIQIMV